MSIETQDPTNLGISLAACGQCLPIYFFFDGLFWDSSLREIEKYTNPKNHRVTSLKNPELHRKHSHEVYYQYLLTPEVISPISNFSDPDGFMLRYRKIKDGILLKSTKEITEGLRGSLSMWSWQDVYGEQKEYKRFEHQVYHHPPSSITVKIKNMLYRINRLAPADELLPFNLGAFKFIHPMDPTRLNGEGSTEVSLLVADSGCMYIVLVHTSFWAGKDLLRLNIDKKSPPRDVSLLVIDPEEGKLRFYTKTTEGVSVEDEVKEFKELFSSTTGFSYLVYWPMLYYLLRTKDLLFDFACSLERNQINALLEEVCENLFTQTSMTPPQDGSITDLISILVGMSSWTRVAEWNEDAKY